MKFFFSIFVSAKKKLTLNIFYKKQSTRSRGYDATTHFESTVDDVLEMYTRITGKVIDLDAVDPDKAGEDE